MQEKSSAFYKRAGALGAAATLAVSGAFIASPAIAAPAADPKGTSAATPAAAVPEVAAEAVPAHESLASETAPDETAPAEVPAAGEAGILPPGLADALLRDLGMTVAEFDAAGELGKKAAAALPKLQATDGFESIAIKSGTLVITGSGASLAALALELDATLINHEAGSETAAEAGEVSAATPAPTNAPDAPGIEEEVSEAPPAPRSLPVDYLAGIAALRADYIANVGVEGLQSILWDGGSYVISVDKAATIDGSTSARSLADAAGTPAEAFARQYNQVRVADSSGTGTPVEDVFNGQGYASPVDGGAYLCSIGFNGFSPAGAPAVITAGHCAQDGGVSTAVLTNPVDDTAGGGTAPSPGTDLGTWGFSQFGGPGNSPVNLDTGANVGTDIAVIDDINSDLDLLPEVTQWEDATDLSVGSTRITGVSDAVIGAPVCKSGRTTGWTCGAVTAIGEFFVGGHNYATDKTDIRGVLGFESTLTGGALPGDSGGPTISGSNALGINSAIGDREDVSRVFSTSLSNGLSRLGGYTVRLFTAAPALTSHQDGGTVLTDEAIRGTAPAGSTVKLTRGETAISLDVVDGTWSFPAPSTVPESKKVEFTVQTVNGFNKSTAVSYGLSVKEAPLAAPAITNPANGAAITDAVTTITGTGVPKAKVSLNITGRTAAEAEGDAGTAAAAADFSVTMAGSVTADDQGTWAWPLDEALAYGEYTVTANQDGIAGKAESPTVSASFTVIPATPFITTITDGQDFAEGSAPRSIAGTGTAGAQLTVTIGETVLTAAVNENGGWTVDGFPVLAPGTFTVSAVQEIDGAVSAAAVVTFTVTAAVIAPQAPPVVPGTTPAPAPKSNVNGLPDTGIAGMGLFAGAGILLTAGGASFLLINRRRHLQDA